MTIGSKFGVQKDGTVYASGIQISYNDLSDKPTIPSSTDFVTWGGSKGILPTEDSHNSSYLGIGTDGQLKVANAVIYGKIYADEGSFGVWNIGTGSSIYPSIKGIYTSGKISDVDYEIGLKSDFSQITNLNYYIRKKNGDTWKTVFSVSNEGRLVAEKAAIGGWRIGKGSYPYNDDQTVSRTTNKEDSAGNYTIPFIEVGLKNQTGNDNYAVFYIQKNTNSSIAPNYTPTANDWTVMASITNAGDINTYSGEIIGINEELKLIIKYDTKKTNSNNEHIYNYPVVFHASRISSGNEEKTFVRLPQLPTCTISNAANVFVNELGSLYKSTSSSRRYKTQISELGSGELDPHGLYKIPVVEYIYKEGYLLQDDINYGKKVIGIIAEDVEKYFPIAASYNQDGLVENWNERFILPGMLKLIQEQHEQITELQSQVSDLISKSV